VGLLLIEIWRAECTESTADGGNHDSKRFDSRRIGRGGSFIRRYQEQSPLLCKEELGFAHRVTRVQGPELRCASTTEQVHAVKAPAVGGRALMYVVLEYATCVVLTVASATFLFGVCAALLIVHRVAQISFDCVRALALSAEELWDRPRRTLLTVPKELESISEGV